MAKKNLWPLKLKVLLLCRDAVTWQKKTSLGPLKLKVLLLCRDAVREYSTYLAKFRFPLRFKGLWPFSRFWLSPFGDTVPCEVSFLPQVQRPLAFKSSFWFSPFGDTVPCQVSFPPSGSEACGLSVAFRFRFLWLVEAMLCDTFSGALRF